MEKLETCTLLLHLAFYKGNQKQSSLDGSDLFLNDSWALGHTASTLLFFYFNNLTQLDIHVYCIFFVVFMVNTYWPDREAQDILH